MLCFNSSHFSMNIHGVYEGEIESLRITQTLGRSREDYCYKDEVKH